MQRLRQVFALAITLVMSVAVCHGVVPHHHHDVESARLHNHLHSEKHDHSHDVASESGKHEAEAHHDTVDEGTLKVKSFAVDAVIPTREEPHIPEFDDASVWVAIASRREPLCNGPPTTRSGRAPPSHRA